MITSTNKTVIYLLSIIFAMICLVIASVPLYNLFCKVTGYSGTACESAAQIIGTKEYIVTFNIDTPKDPKWNFKALSKNLVTKTGKNNLAIFEFNNISDQEVTVISLYNVLPIKAAKYFNKVECFCYEELIFPANSTQQLPVSFYLDSAIEQDPFLKNIDKITLSYSVIPQH